MVNNSSSRCYQKKKRKGRLQNKARERYEYLFEEEKEKKQQYARKRYKNLPKHEKQRLFE